MSHPFGDLVTQHLARKHGLSQAKLAAGIQQPPFVISRMCQGQRLTGPQARARVLAIIGWLQQQHALGSVAEANALLDAAGMAALRTTQPEEAQLLETLSAHATGPPETRLGRGQTTPPPATGNVPLPVSSFIGREREIAEVRRILSSLTTRLLTLTGPAGVGKTRLALAVAASLLKEYADGVWWVELAALADPTLLPQILAAALGAREQPGQAPGETLTAFLERKHMLVVLDNCEHLVAACTQLALTLLHAAPNLQLLVTSREAIALPGAISWPVPPLILPDARQLPPLDVLMHSEAVQLFCERAAAVLPTFRLTEQNASLVVQICHRLDGLPLAIELAAARVKLFTVEQIAEYLDDCLRLLAHGSLIAPAHQQTLRSTLDWSYALLSPPEQCLLRRLAIFAGSFTFTAVEAVCGGSGLAVDALLDLLAGLVDKSLVQVAEREHAARYRLLETTRQYGYEKLMVANEAEPLHARHLAFFLQVAEEAEVHLKDADHIDWVNRLETEYANMRAALAWVLGRVPPASGGHEHPGPRTTHGAAPAQGNGGQSTTTTESRVLAGVRLAGALQRFWMIRGYWKEGHAWLSALVELGMPLLEPEAHAGDQATLDHHRETMAVLAKLLYAAGSFEYGRGDLRHGVDLAEQSVRLYQTVGDQKGIADALSALGSLLFALGEIDRAWVIWEECLALRRDQGDKRGWASTLSGLAQLAWQQRDAPRARALMEESLRLYRELEHQPQIVLMLNKIGWLLLQQGETAPVRALLAESLTIIHEQGSTIGMTAVCDSLMIGAMLAGAEGRFVHAVRLLGAADNVLHDELTVARQYYERILAPMRAHLDATACDAAWAEGKAMALEDVLAATLTPLVEGHAEAEPLPGNLHNAAPADDSARHPAEHTPIIPLSRREHEVVCLLAAGATNQEIAQQLVLALPTVKTHCRTIYRKLGVTGRTQVPARARALGLL